MNPGLGFFAASRLRVTLLQKPPTLAQLPSDSIALKLLCPSSGFGDSRISHAKTRRTRKERKAAMNPSLGFFAASRLRVTPLQKQERTP